jgi:hypothetical protein
MTSAVIRVEEVAFVSGMFDYSQLMTVTVANYTHLRNLFWDLRRESRAGLCMVV